MSGHVCIKIYKACGIRVINHSMIFINVLISQVQPITTSLSIRTNRKVPKLGVMLVGWGGNNGSTITAALEANRRKLEWRTRTGKQQANWYVSRCNFFCSFINFTLIYSQVRLYYTSRYCFIRI